MTNTQDYELVAGLEIHIQLNTNTKLFSADTTAFGEEPNTQINEVSLAHPGTLPVLNDAAVEKAIKLGLAFGCEITRDFYFDRKHYFYPDSPLGYQITQQNTPICVGGQVSIPADDEEKFIALEKIHMEADAGKSIHDLHESFSYIDLNRAGMPLLELVTKPVFYTIADVASFVNEVQQTVRFLGISDGNMEEGSLRCDANISVRPKGSKALGSKVEIKNMNSVRHIRKALETEFNRQCGLLIEGKNVEVESRLFNIETGKTQSMRDKEEAHDYRYFPEPDLAPVHIEEEKLETIRHEMPLVPSQLRSLFNSDYQINSSDSIILAYDIPMTQLLIGAFEAGASGQDCAKWILGPVKGLANQATHEQFLLTGAQLAELVKCVNDGELTYKNGVEVVLPELVKDPKLKADTLIQELGLSVQKDSSELEAVISEILVENPSEVAAYKKGKKAILQLFMGKVMKATRGKADPKTVIPLLQQLLNK
jgi:aspartyl-tRNA(Asn)/glutamyl-tRNA(Gln) amidotransferase subunit B